MMSESTQHKLSRVRPPRVQITYDVETGDAIQRKQLKFVVGIMADLGGDPAQVPAKLKERKFVEIDRDNFDHVMQSISPTIKLSVPNRLNGEQRTFAPELTFTRMEDFNPASLVRQIPELAKLFEARTRLNDLLAKLDGNDKLERILNTVTRQVDQQKELSGDIARNLADDATHQAAMDAAAAASAAAAAAADAKAAVDAASLAADAIGNIAVKNPSDAAKAQAAGAVKSAKEAEAAAAKAATAAVAAEKAAATTTAAAANLPSTDSAAAAANAAAAGTAAAQAAAEATIVAHAVSDVAKFIAAIAAADAAIAQNSAARVAAAATVADSSARHATDAADTVRKLLDEAAGPGVAADGAAADPGQAGNAANTTTEG